MCGALDPELALGSLVVFDDLHFPVNRLPDGSLCTLHTEPGAPGRGHWIFDRPVQRAAAPRAAATAAREAGCDGARRRLLRPRRRPALQHPQRRSGCSCGAGVTAVSQTAGPETVLAGEAKLPYALLGYATDYANGVKPEAPTPVEELVRLVAASTETFARTLAAAVPRVTAGARAGGDAFLLGLTSAARWPPSSSARSPRRDDPGLDELLGGDGARALRAELAARARRWAAEVAPGPRLRGDDARRRAGRAARPRRARAAGRARRAGARPAPGARRPRRPRRRLRHRRWAPPTTRGPTSSPSPRPDPELLALVERSLDGGVLGAFAERGVTLGMLRHERRLASAGDARALAIDPLAPPDLVALVRERLPEPPRR